MITLFSYQLTYLDLFLIYAVAFCIGMSKAGVHGASMIGVPILALVFGGRNSSGMLLPMLVIADFFGVKYYHQHASWKHLKILFPWAALGVIAGTVTGSYINDEVFKTLMAIIIIISVVVMIWLEQGHKEDVPHHPWFAVLMGIAGGFTSMIGNLASAVMGLFIC